MALHSFSQTHARDDQRGGRLSPVGSPEGTGLPDADGHMHFGQASIEHGSGTHY